MFDLFDVEAQTSHARQRGGAGTSASPGLFQRARAAVGRTVGAITRRFRRG